MISSRIVLMALALFGVRWESAKRVEFKSIWTITLSDPFLRDRGGFQGTPETNRSCGIAIWDESRVFIYWLTSTRHLAERQPIDMQEGAWMFSTLIVNTSSGKVERSESIPADSTKSELIVVAGGLVERDQDRLIFYTRNFKRTGQAFTYKPLHGPMHFFKEGTISDPEYLYATADQRKFILVDSYGRLSHIFLFDGVQLSLISDWVVRDVDWHDISIGDTGILYTGFDYETTKKVYWTTFDGHTEEWRSAALSGRDQACVVPVYKDPDTFLNVCGSPEIISRKNRNVIYHSQKKERTGLPTTTSPDRHIAAILKYKFKGGGVLDLDEHQTHTDLLIVRLNGEHESCEIPIIPPPRSQLSFSFGNNSTLIVLNDALVTAYKIDGPMDEP